MIGIVEALGDNDEQGRQSPNSHEAYVLKAVGRQAKNLINKEEKYQVECYAQC